TLVNVNALGDPVPSSRFMGGRAFAMLGADPVADIAAADRDAVLDGGIMLLPAVPDDSGPYRGRKAEWRGDARSLGPGGHLYAVSLHLGLMTAVSLKSIGAEGDVIVEGPFARNATFLETLAVVTGSPGHDRRFRSDGYLRRRGTARARPRRPHRLGQCGGPAGARSAHRALCRRMAPAGRIPGRLTQG
ncbi:MAG: hypothetical protein V9F04_08775, partial [Dermatophilaceae bacterium]